MTTGIVKNKNRRKRIKILWYLFIMFSSMLIINNPGRTADLGLISADRLQKTSSNWIIIDARPKGEWLSGHIPGARPFDWEDYTRTDEKNIPYRTIPPQKLADAFGKIGIVRETSVVVYGDAGSSWGGEGWVCWALIWIGHQGPLRLLEGGIQMWKASDFSLKKGDESYTQEPLMYAYQVWKDVNITAADIQNNISAIQLVDTRSLLEWFKGRIPGAVHISWKKFYKNKNRHPLGLSEVTTLLRDHGINPERQVVYYCTGGIRSGYAWLVHSLAGLPIPVNYEGGMVEWETIFP